MRSGEGGPIAPAGEPAGPAPVRGATRRRRGAAAAASAAVALVLWGGTAAKAFSLWIAAFDLGYFVQALGTVALRGPFAPVPMLGESFLGDHFSPLLIPIAPLALLPGAPYWLLGVQATAVAGAAVVVWRMLSASGTSRPVAAAAVFVTTPAVMYAVWNDFHASTAALPFVAVFALGVVRRHPRTAVGGAVLASLVREDVALSVGLLAAYVCIRWWRPAVWAAIPALAVGLGYPLAGGGSGWLTRSGLDYLAGRAWFEVPGAVASVVWDGGGLLLLALAAVGPWVLVGRPRWGVWAAYLVSVLPYLALATPNVHTIGLHYYSTSAVVGALSVAGRTRRLRPAVLPTVAAIAALLGPFGLSVFHGGTPPGVFVFRDAWANRERNRQLQDLAWGLDTGPVSVVQPLVAFVDPRNVVYPWPAPYRDLVLSNITPVPILPADPDVEPVLVVAPRVRFDLFVPAVTPDFERGVGLRPIGDVAGVTVFETRRPGSGEESGEG